MRDTSRQGGLLAGTTTDRPRLAASLLIGSLFFLGLQDSIVKLTSGDVSMWQFQVIRALFILGLLLLFTRVIWGVTCPRPKRFWAIALRSTFLASTMVFFFGGIPVLSLAVVAAGLYVFPLFVALLSALVLGERVGPRRVVAILVGFGGTLLILKPGTEAFQPIALMPIGAALCYAGQILTTRRLCRDESPITLAYGVSLSYMAYGVLGLIFIPLFVDGDLAASWPYLFTGWRETLSLWTVALTAVAAALNVTVHIGLARAYQSAEATWLASFDYSYLIFATFWGFVFWRHIPDTWTVVGMVMIAGAGTFVAWRERRENRLPTERAGDRPA
jgi:drug/metabolite transporter (DMT)-like permease